MRVGESIYLAAEQKGNGFATRCPHSPHPFLDNYPSTNHILHEVQLFRTRTRFSNWLGALHVIFRLIVENPGLSQS